MSKIEVNTVEPQCGTTLTLGACGQTVALGSGASQTGFGRTGTVDWITTPKVTGDSPVTGVTGKGYFLNTTSGTITINLPAGSAGDIISMADYAATWQTNKVTVSANGSEKIGGDTNDATLSTEGQSVTFVYVDSTQGWVNTMDSTSNVRGAGPFIVATGGTPCSGAIVCTNYKIHTFTGPGTFTVTEAGTPAGSTALDYLVTAGGGGGGFDNAGGGGAGGLRFATGLIAMPAAPANPRAGAASITAAAQGYPITVGSGGAGGVTGPCQYGGKGSDSIFSTITSTGGGAGTHCTGAPTPTTPGGSGAGTAQAPPGGCGGTSEPATSPAQGTAGGSSAPSPSGAGGGGGFLVAGANNSGNTGGAGGAGGGFTTDFGTGGVPCGSYQYYSGGGGGGGAQPGTAPGGVGGLGGGGAGGNNTCAGTAGTVNTGGGSGGGAQAGDGGLGGSGVVIIRYKFQ